MKDNLIFVLSALFYFGMVGWFLRVCTYERRAARLRVDPWEWHDWPKEAE